MSENNSSNGGGKLVRPKNGRLVAGVCTGLAAYFKIDVNLIRLLFGVFTFLWGLGALLYVVAWAVLPEEGEDASILESFINKTKNR